MHSPSMSIDRAPVSGTCPRCGCALGYLASRREDLWYCCGACGGSDRCACGCKPQYAREQLSDCFIPTRRMFAARRPDDLHTPPDYDGGSRAFPFADSRRGR